MVPRESVALVKRADHENWDFAGRRLRMQNLADGEPIEIRQQNIQQDQVGIFQARDFERLHSVGSAEDLAALVTKIILQQLPEIFFVVDDQHFRFHASTLPRPYPVKPRRIGRGIAQGIRVPIPNERRG